MNSGGGEAPSEERPLVVRPLPGALWLRLLPGPVLLPAALLRALPPP